MPLFIVLRGNCNSKKGHSGNWYKKNDRLRNAAMQPAGSTVVLVHASEQ